MCGIFGYVGSKEAAPILLQGLSRLEYRGYDSAGIAVLNDHQEIQLVKKKGKVRDLKVFLTSQMPLGHIGLGHTRWATHGAPNDINSHPHLNTHQSLALIHNGIIENYLALKIRLQQEGYQFVSETDSEVLVHLISKYFAQKKDLRLAVYEALKEVEGSFAIGVLHSDEPDRVIAARKDSPLVIGLGKNENFISSDIAAILDYTRSCIPVHDGEVAIIEKNKVTLCDSKGNIIERAPQWIEWDIQDAEKQGFDHFMLKEIYEQPKIVGDLLARRIKEGRIYFEELLIKPEALVAIQRVMIVACGTSYHAGLVGRYFMEHVYNLPVYVDTSSEFRYRNPKLNSHDLVIVISQSGETADTLAAVREAKSRGALVLAICNVLSSSIEREADGVIYTHAGPEIAVASTKAYTAQITALYLFALYLKSEVFHQRDAQYQELLTEFRLVPQKMQKFLDYFKTDRKTWQENVQRFRERHLEQLKNYLDSQKKNSTQTLRAPNAFFLYTGRNINYPSALEGALKLKEIAYISAEGYAAGELKHGPIALIDENPWVICIAVKSLTYEKMVSNIQEIKARGGMVTAIVTEGDHDIKKLGLYLYIEVPPIHEMLSPLLVALPLQLIAYSVAIGFGEDIDQPRNLAKSVTVE